MLKMIYKSTVATLLLAVLLCGIYPLLVTAVGALIFSGKANGGMITKNNQIIGAQLIGQPFTKPEYFHGRPSAAGSAPSAPNGYDASNSSGSNLGPTNQKLSDGLKANIDAVLKENPNLKSGEVPVDLVTNSASGLDPHISPEGAKVQISRVAHARGVSEDQIEKLVSENTEGPQLGLFGEATVNVLLLNVALDESVNMKQTGK